MTTISFVVVDLTPKHILELNVIFFFFKSCFCQLQGPWDHKGKPREMFWYNRACDVKVLATYSQNFLSNDRLLLCSSNYPSSGWQGSLGEATVTDRGSNDYGQTFFSSPKSSCMSSPTFQSIWRKQRKSWKFLLN